MTDPRASTALLSLPLGDPPPSRWSWAVVAPDPTGRVQLPAAALEALGAGPARARAAGDVLVLSIAGGPGRTVGIDRRGRCYLPRWLRRPAVLVATDPAEQVVLITDAAELDTLGDQLLRAVRS